MNFLSFKLFKNFAVDILLFHKYRDFSDGVTLVTGEINLDLYEADHNPKFAIRFGILNVYLLQFEIYNTLHVEDK